MAMGLDADARKKAREAELKAARDKRYRTNNPQYKIYKAGQNARRRTITTDASKNPVTGENFKTSNKSYSRSVERLKQTLAGEDSNIKQRERRKALANKQIEQTGRAAIPRKPRGIKAVKIEKGHINTPIAAKGKNADFNMGAQSKAANSRQRDVPRAEMKYGRGYAITPASEGEFKANPNPDFMKEELARLRNAKLQGTLGGARPLRGMAAVTAPMGFLMEYLLAKKEKRPMNPLKALMGMSSVPSPVANPQGYPEDGLF